MNNLAQMLEHLRRRFWIKVAGRLIRQQNPRRVGDGAGDGNTLLLATRQGARAMTGPLAQSDHGQKLFGTCLGSQCPS